MAETLGPARNVLDVAPTASLPVLADVRYPAAPASPAAGFGASFAAALAGRRLFVLFPFAMIAGLIVSVQLPAEPALPVLVTGAALIGLGLLVWRRSLPLVQALAVLAALWSGLCLLPVHGALLGTDMLARPVYGTYQARVDEILSATAAEKRVLLSAITPTGTSRPVPVRRARVFIRGGPDLSPGDIIAAPFRFSEVPGPVYPGGFDTQFHAFFDGIGAYGNSTRPPEIVSHGSETAPEYVVDAVRRGIAVRIDAVLSQPAAGIARAIINGDQSEVTEQARQTMATAGIAHVLSVSGLHLTIVAGGVFWAVRLLLASFSGIGQRLPVKRIAAVVGIVSAVVYYGISGGNVAAFRSTLMILLVFGAVLFGRRALTMRNVAIAGIVVIACDPASVFRPSFQLSFSAVLALVGAFENLRTERLKDAGPIARALAYGRGVVITSLVAGAATLLFSVYHFQQTSPLSVLGNLASLPLVGFIMMPMSLVAVLAMPFGIEWPVLVIVGWSIDMMLLLAGFVADWSQHISASPLLTPLALVIAVAALGWFAFFRDRWRLVGPIAAVPLVVLFALDRPPDVLIADTTQAMAVRGESGLELAGGKSASFALNVWRETYVEPIAATAPQSCDSVACIGAGAPGFSYAIIKDPGGFAEECDRVDLVITRLRAPGYCAAGVIVDAGDLAAHGVHWLRWDATTRSFELRPAVGEHNRPWRIMP